MSSTLTERAGGFLPTRIERSFLAKMAVLFVAILVVVGSVGGLQYMQANAHVHEEAHESLLESVEENYDQLSRWTVTNNERALLLSSADELAADDEMSDYLDSRYAYLPDEVVDLSVVDLESARVLASTTDGTVGTTMTGIQTDGVSPTFESPDGVLGANKYEWQGDADADVMPYVSPVAADPSRALVVTVLTAPVEDLITDGSTVMHIIMPGGVIGFDSAGEHEGEPYPAADSEAFAAATNAAAGESGVVEQDALAGVIDEPHLVGYVSLGHGVAVMVHQPASEAYATAGDIARAIEYILLATGLGFLALGIVLSRTTVRPLRALHEKVGALRDGDLDVDLRTGRQDEFGSVLGGVAALRDDLRDQRADAERYSHVMERAATGDLTARMDADSDSRDMRVIASTFNDMMDDLEATVVSVRSFGDDVAALSERMAGSADEVSHASDEVSRAIQQIADGAGEQNDTLLDVSASMNDMSASVEQIAASADELATAMERAIAKGDTGRDAATEALDGIEQIQTETDSTAAEMTALNERMEEIGEIVEVITDIAEQTNILALNANIEAARAGEAGEGFAVVSNEVKNLAEKTKASAQQIEHLIDGLRAQQRTVLGGVDDMRARVEDGSASVTTALTALEEIVEEVDETSATVAEINDATSAQADATQSIHAMTDDAAAISEETAAEAENVSAAAQEQAASLSEVSTGTQELSRTARQLRDHLAAFVVDGSDHGGDGAAADATAPIPAGPGPVATDGGHGDQ